MSESTRPICSKCGDPADPMIRCLVCHTFFCRRCSLAKRINNEPGLPELISSCPKCKSEELSYVD